MKTRHALMLGVAAIALMALVAGVPSQPGAQTPAVAIDNDDIGGVVTGPKGPEAGVWVIAETTDLPTKYAKIVVTDDQGRYVLPDLPKAKYKVWVRGYGLVDSAKVDAEPGRQLNLTAAVAPDDKAAAQYYPPIYWYSMLRIPTKDRVPRHRSAGQRHQSGYAPPAPLAHRRQIARLHVVPRARHARHAHDPERVRRFRQLARCLDAPHPGRTGHGADGRRGDPSRSRPFHCRMGELDRSRRCRRDAQAEAAHVRKASSATSCSRSGIGAIRRPISTT